MIAKELHDYLLKHLRNKNSQSPNIAEYKETIRNELRAYRSDQPSPPVGALTPYPSNGKDIVFYSFMEPFRKPKIGEHEYKRLKLSWSSLRKYNTDIEIRFCYNGNKKMWSKLCEEYGVKMYPFHSSFTGKEPNAWCIHRWYNLALWKDESLNVLYMDADTYVNGDIQLVFDIYKRDPIYGREELGFRHDPNLVVCGEDPRFYLDLIDASIVAQGGKTEV